MRSFHLTVWGVILFFVCVMGVVGAKTLMRPSGSTGIDPAKIHRLRENANK